jgi:hypothetical protein
MNLSYLYRYEARAGASPARTLLRNVSMVAQVRTGVKV